MPNTVETPAIKVNPSPKGTAIWPKLDKPDTKWKPEGEYTLKLKVAAAEAEGLCKQIDQLAERHLEAVKAELVKQKKGGEAKKLSLSKDKPYVAECDDDGNETGFVIFKVKMKASGVSKKTNKPWTRRPLIVDAKGVVIPESKIPPIGGGSVLKFGGSFEAYDNAKREVGVTGRLEAVQIIELRTFADRDAADFGFGAEEGYDASDAPDTSGFQDETSPTTGGDAKNAGDF